MLKKSLAMCLAVILMLSLNVNIALASDTDICADDFESYTNTVGGGWVGQVTAAAGGTQSVPLEDMGRGKSAKVVSNTSTRKELLMNFSRTGASVTSVDFEYSIYLADRKSVRSLYTRCDSLGEMRLLTFGRETNTVSTWSREIPAEVFTYETGVWYDIHVRYNMGGSFIRIEISDGAKTTVLQEAAQGNATGLWRVDFASFSSIEGESVTYIDDVRVYASQPADFYPDTHIVCDNFENNFKEKFLSGYACSAENNSCEAPFGWEYTDFGKSGVLSLSGGSAALSKEIDYLHDEKLISMSFKVLSDTATGKLTASLDGINLIEIDFLNNTLRVGKQSYQYTFSRQWYDFSVQYAPAASHIDVTVAAGGVKKSFEGFSETDSPSPMQLSLCAQTAAGQTDKIYIDNLYLFSAFQETQKVQQQITNDDNTENSNIVTETFDGYSGGTPQGWFTQISPAGDTSCSFSESGGGVMMTNRTSIFELIRAFDKPAKTVKCVKYCIRVRLEDNNADRCMYLRDWHRGEMPILNFMGGTNTVSIASTTVPACEFTYETGVAYDVTVLYNTENGYIRATFDDGESVKTVEGKGRENITWLYRVYFVSFKSKNSSPSKAVVYGITLDAVNPVYQLRNDSTVSGGNTFETYISGVPSGFEVQADSGCAVVPQEGRYGVNVKMESAAGGSCILRKSNLKQPENYFSIKFSAMFEDFNAKRQLLLGDTSIISFEQNGTVTLGSSALSATELSYKTNRWYTFEITGNMQSGELSLNVKADTCSFALSGVFTAGTADKISVKSTGGESAGAWHFDNFLFTPSGLLETVPGGNLRSVSPDITSFSLLFSEDIQSGRILLNGSDALIKNISFNGRRVTAELEALERTKEYTLSYADMTSSAGSYCGHITFKTGAGVEITDAGFKKPQSEDERISAGVLTAYANYKSADNAQKNISFVAAVYDKDTGRLLTSVCENAVAGENTGYTEICMQIPQESQSVDAKLFLWEDGTMKPLAQYESTSPFLRPDGEAVVALLQTQNAENKHPRILADENDFNRVREYINTDERMKRWYMQVRAEADKYLYLPCVEYDIYDGIRLSSPTEIRERVISLGFMYKITGDAKYAEKLYAELENAANYKDWNPNHYLDAATMMDAFGIGYDWIYDYIAGDSEKKALIIEAVRKFGFETVLDDYLNRSRWRTYKWTLTNEPDNWNIICNSGALVAALAFGDELPQYAQQIFDNALPHIEKALVRFAPDGAWFEGVGYWVYEMRFLADMLSSMNVALGTDFGLSDAPGFDKTAYYPFAMTGPAGLFNFHNSASGFINSEQIFLLARLTKDNKAAALQTKFLDDKKGSGGVLSLLWYDPTAPHDDTSLPLDFYFRDTEVCTMRSGWDSNATFVGFHAGKNNLPHGHLDVGEFVIDMLGERFACELGAEDYTIKTSSAWELYRKRAEGHNTLCINPDINPDQVDTADAVIDRFEATPQRALSVIDMTSAYSDKVHSAVRGIQLTQNRSAVIIKDEISGRAPLDLWWFMHTAADITVSQDGKSAQLMINNKYVKAQILGDNTQTFQVMDAQPFATSPQNAAQNKNEGIKKLAIHVSGQSDVNITVAVLPLDAQLQSTDIKSINEW